MQSSLHSHLSIVKSQLLRAARQVLNQEQRNGIKNWLTVTRKRLRKLHLIAHGQYTARELVGELRARIPEDFDILMVHSAYDRLLPMYAGTPQQLVKELVELCGRGRTLVMPAFVLGGRSYDPAAYYRSHVFDARKAFSEMGLVTEIFRRMPGVKRSLHPTHSICALGPHADMLTASHHLASTRTGPGTPFERMAQHKTVIVGLGVEYYRCLTQIHTAEDTLGDQFPIRMEADRVRVTVVDERGSRLAYELIVKKTPPTFDLTILRSMLSESELLEWRFKGTALFMTFADKVTSRLVAAARRGITVYGTPPT